MKTNHRNTSFLKSSLLLTLTLFMLVFAGCGVASVFVNFSRVNGIVTDAVTHSPIHRVYVSAQTSSWSSYYTYDRDYTDSEGRYSLSLGSGTYDFYFERDDYEFKRVRDIVIVEPFSRSLDVEMIPYSSPSPTPTPSASPLPSPLPTSSAAPFPS